MAAAAEPIKTRVLSLDALRGATIALMVLVNTPGDGNHVFTPLEHAEWHGWTLADTVFPTFVWIVGLSLTLSLGKKLDRGEPRAAILRQVVRRAAIIFALGVFLYLVPNFDFSTMRILGVLQRIAICFFAASAIYLWTTWRGQITWTIFFLAAFWMIMFYAPTPGFGPGRLDIPGNFAHYVDRVVLGVHNYQSTKTWDPEGIVSTLPAIATALLGVLAGHIFQNKRPLSERTTWLFLAGNALLTMGVFLDQWLPINKHIWTTSFALFMAGIDYILFAACLWLIDRDAREHRWAKPLIILGSNAIAIYLASELIETLLSTTGAKAWVFGHFFAPFAPIKVASVLYAIVYVLLMYAIAWFLYRRRLFLKV
jgi:predicted acyltransferase